jgi:adenylylsulfate kinase-like enzyme
VASLTPCDSEPARQPTTDAQIWIICGNACAGKTTTARLLAQRFPRAAHVDGDEMQRLIVSGCRWAVPADSDPVTGRLTGEAGVQYALRIRNACLVAAAFADAGITAVVTDSIVSDGFGSLTEVLGGRPVNFVVLRPPVTVLRQRGADRLPEEAAYLADRYGALSACRTSGSGLIPVASIRKASWISCLTARLKLSG